MAADYTQSLPTPLGMLTVHAHDAAITALNWDDKVGGAPGNAITAQAIEALAAYFDGDITALDDLPVDPDVTPFRRQVLTAMRRIPAGQVDTYGDLGRAAGASPGAVRAVGSACATNPIPIIIPCHRVVAAGGKMGGFSGAGGLDTKEWLLRHEGWQPMRAQSTLL